VAYFLDDPNDPNKQQAGGVSGASGGGGTAGGAPRQQRGSGNFLSVDRLLNANKGIGATQANRLAGQTQQQVDQAQGAISNAGTAFNNDVRAGMAKVDQFNPQAATMGTRVGRAITPQVGPTPQQYAPQIQAYQQAVTRQYTGPTDPGSYYADAAKATQAAQARAAQLGTVEGRQGLGGMSMLDSLLAGREGAGTLQAAQQQAQALGGTLGSAMGTSATAGQDALQSADASRQYAATQLTRLLGQQDQATHNQAKQQQMSQDYNQYTSAYNAAPGPGFLGWISRPEQLTPEQYAALSPDIRAALSAGDAKKLRDLGYSSNPFSISG
jgi:hypothetical protein